MSSPGDHSTNAVKVVTGATGYIGGTVARALADRGDPVRAIFLHKRPSVFFHHRRPFVREPGIEWVAGDVLERDSMVAAFRDADVVFHLASLVSTDPRMDDAVWATTVIGTRNVVEAALECGVRRLIYFSSIVAYNQLPLDDVLDETRDRDGTCHTVYDQAKKSAEEEVRAGIERGLDAVILNPTSAIGPYDTAPSPMGQFFVDLHRQNLPLLLKAGFNLVDVRDLAEATVAAESRGRRGENYILSGHWHSLIEVAQISQAITGVPSPRFTCPIAVARAWAPFQIALDRIQGRPLHLTRGSLNLLALTNRQISNAKAREELGFDPRPTADSVRDAYRWFEEHGMLDG